MEYVLRVLLDMPFWCSFRDPTGINVHSTFRLPPLTTLYGLVANSLGMAQDDYSLRPALRFGIAIERSGELVETYSKIMKVREAKTPEEAARPGNLFISTAVIKQKLIRPSFWMYLQADQERLRQVQAALEDPARPLYLGESDDMVDVIAPVLLSAEYVQTNRFDCAVPGIYPLQAGETSASIASLPYHFLRRGKSDWGLLRRPYMYPSNSRQSLLLENSLTGFNIQGRHIIFEPPIAEETT